MDFITDLRVEPVGRWFLCHWSRLQTHRTLSATGDDSDSESASEESQSGDEFKDDDDIEYLRSLNPKECKEQDHYRVLGLAKLRIAATDEQIKRAYRSKVLRHHPDKRRAAGEDLREDDDYFTCITAAAEILSNPIKRRAFDSVDPTFDDDVPDAKSVTAGEDFFKVFAPVFERNSRWSVKKPVPQLGDENSSREKVDRFYKFWYDFESWREYSYLDEEDKERGSDREERRWIEKNNKIERAERKKDEMKRIRKLVDNAYSCDHRIAKFLEKDKQEKLAKKKARQDAARARKEEEDRQRREAEERERLERERKESEERAKLEVLKKEKEAQKKLLKTKRKLLRTLCKDSDFFAADEKEKVAHMAEVDKLCEVLDSGELDGLNKALSESGRDAFLNAVEVTNGRLEKEKMAMVEKTSKGSTGAEKSSGGGPPWSTEELSLLIKAVNLFPAGTNQRWEVVASFINQHTNTPDIQRKAKETLGKAKELQQSDFHVNVLKEEANKKAYENLEKQKKRDVKVESEASTRMESAAEAQGLNISPWTSDEQQLLEQALKTYPSSLGTDRWEKIANCIPNRSKKDCMKRYKFLAEIVRAKKGAQAAALAAAKK